MSNPIPNQLALTSIADGSQRLAAPIRNNYSAIQTAVNELVVALSGGTVGQVLQAVDATDVQWAPSPAFSGVSVCHSVNQTLTASTTTHIAWNTELYDQGGYHDTVTNNSRLTVPAGLGGYFLASVLLDVQTGATSALDTVQIIKNGSTGYSKRNHPETAAYGVLLQALIQLNAGDYVEAWYVNANTANHTLTGSSGSSVFTLMRLGG